MNQTFANTNDRAFVSITNFVTKYCSSSQILHFSHIRMWGGTLGLAYLPRSISEIWELARNCLWLPCVFYISGRKAISTLEILTSRGRNENMVIYMSLSWVRIKCHRSRNDIYGMILCCHHHCDTKSLDCSCLYYHGCEKCMRNKANLGDLIAATSVVILLILDWNRRFFRPCDLQKSMNDLKNIIGHILYTTPSFLHHFKSIGDFK